MDDIEGIGGAFTSFYQNLYGTARTYRHQINWNVLLGDKVNHNLSNLDAPFTHDEIKVMVFGLSADNVPGPDRPPMFFFQKFWEIVKTNIFVLCEDFLFGESQLRNDKLVEYCVGCEKSKSTRSLAL